MLDGLLWGTSEGRERVYFGRMHGMKGDEGFGSCLAKI